MICPACCEDRHRACLIGCTCQHVGSGVPYMNDAARHALAVGPVDPPSSAPPAITIRSNGASDGQ